MYIQWHIVLSKRVKELSQKGQPDASFDCAQACFLIVLDAKHSFSLHKEELSWLASIYWNICIRPLLREFNTCFKMTLDICKVNN